MKTDCLRLQRLHGRDAGGYDFLEAQQTPDRGPADFSGASALDL